MTSPAASAEEDAVRKRQQDHANQVALTKQSATTTTTPSQTPPPPPPPSMGLTPRSAGGVPSRKKRSKLARSHEKRVRSELHDVMTRASNDVKGRVVLGQGPTMMTGGFMTPLQEKLRAAQENSSPTELHSSTTRTHWPTSRARATPKVPGSRRRRQLARQADYIDPCSHRRCPVYTCVVPPPSCLGKALLRLYCQA